MTTTIPEHDNQAEDRDVLPAPYLTWVYLALAYEPHATPTDSRVKTLRRNHAVSPGHRVPVRSTQGLSGSRHWYSSLDFCSALLLARRQPERAAEVADLASALEREFLTVLDSDVRRSGSAWLRLFALRTEEVSRGLLDELALTRTTAWWRSIRDGEAVLEADDGRTWALPVTSPYLSDSSLGDPVIVVEGRAESGAPLWLVVPGVVLDGEETGAEPDEDVDTLVDQIAPGLSDPIPDTEANRAAIARLLGADRPEQ